MTLKTITGLLLLSASLALASAMPAAAQTTNKKPHVPLEKTIGQVTPTGPVPSLAVLNSDGATLADGKLTLKGVSTNTIVFADRPVRAAGHQATAQFIEQWDEGKNSFAVDPPNATVSVLGGDGSDVSDAVVVLTKPKLDGTTLTFDVKVLEEAFPAPMVRRPCSSMPSRCAARWAAGLPRVASMATTTRRTTTARGMARARWAARPLPVRLSVRLSARLQRTRLPAALRLLSLSALLLTPQFLWVLAVQPAPGGLRRSPELWLRIGWSSVTWNGHAATSAPRLMPGPALMARVHLKKVCRARFELKRPSL